MIELTGESLGKRQQELNAKVKKAIQNEILFKDIKSAEEQSDIDRLYKIDVASQYKNIDYIVEVLKCGDSLYVSRALKCEWLYNDEYAHIINPNYLEDEIFPHMSLKMKTKMIKTIADKVRNEKRAIDFYEYYKILRMDALAFKFLLSTTESFKMDTIKDNFDYARKHPKLLKFYINNSFSLANAYLSELGYGNIKKGEAFTRLSYLYNIDENKYLDLFENYSNLCTSFFFSKNMSKSILTKHKIRVLRIPITYITKMYNGVLYRHSTADDVKQYISVLFPTEVEYFWSCNFYQNYKELFDHIPKTEVFNFCKNTFISKYGNEPFEMNINFYYQKYHQMLTIEEREEWALKHIERGEELLGKNNDFIWYRFVNFEKAIEAIKQYILVTTDETARNKMSRILIDSCRNEKDLENLLNYYYQRYIKEIGHHKERFIDKVMDKYNIFEFDAACWEAFNKILYSKEVYTPGFHGKNSYRMLCIIYNILHGIDMPEALMFYIDTDFDFYEMRNFYKHLKKEQLDSVCKYLFNCFIKKFHKTSSTSPARIETVHKLIIIYLFLEKDKDYLPSSVESFIKMNIEEFGWYGLWNPKKEEKLKDATLLRLLKKDNKLVISKFSEIQERMMQCNFRLTHLLRKLRVYFYNDIAKDFVNFFTKCIEDLSTSKYPMAMYVVRTAVYGIFQLTDEATKSEFLKKYVPEEGKISHSEINKKILTIQEQICRFACYSRPPVPLESITQYIKGDYIHYCLPMINMYMVKLPLSVSIKLTEFLLNSPVSIQKHGIRLAFQVYSTDNLKSLISQIWQNTKNVSLRKVIYCALVKKIGKSHVSVQYEFIDSLYFLTSSLNEDDQTELYDCMLSDKVPETFKTDLYKNAYICTRDFSDKKIKNLELKANIVHKMRNFRPDRGFCRFEIIDDFVHYMLHEDGIQQTHKYELTKVHDQFWQFTFEYIVTCNNLIELEDSLAFLQTFLELLFKRWNVVVDDKYVVIELFYEFIKQIKEISYRQENEDCIIQIFEKILRMVQEYYPSHVMYRIILDLTLLKMMIKIKIENPWDSEYVAKLAYESLVMFIKVLRSNNQLFPGFMDETCSIITNNLVTLASIKKINYDILIAYLCNEIVAGTDIDLLRFSITMLPLDVTDSDYQQELFRVLSGTYAQKLKHINNFEIQSLYYNKFILQDFKKRYEC
ncbi:uncharacterized protein LOC123703131 [Colias croceus]|uniref:uncharacterized protein LOC123703131 n=1 Tax=Colias crocea TaxID=72248 RepID=UPI001E280653|nr:uncharacterized protein LOC123703131 [Colias croceus]